MNLQFAGFHRSQVVWTSFGLLDSENLKEDPSTKLQGSTLHPATQPFMGWGHNIMYDIVGFLSRLHSCCLKITSPWRHSSPRRVRSMQWCIVWHCSCGNSHGCLNKSMRRGFGLRQSQISWSSVILCICFYSHTYTCFLWCWDGNTCKKRTTRKQLHGTCKNCYVSYVLQNENATTQIWKKKNTLSQLMLKNI